MHDLVLQAEDLGTGAPQAVMETPKATTKRALLAGLRNGNLDKAVDTIEVDTAVPEVAPEPEPMVRLSRTDTAQDGLTRTRSKGGTERRVGLGVSLAFLQSFRAGEAAAASARLQAWTPAQAFRHAPDSAMACSWVNVGFGPSRNPSAGCFLVSDFMVSGGGQGVILHQDFC